jgi:hypothetical protein
VLSERAVKMAVLTSSRGEFHIVSLVDAEMMMFSRRDFATV